MDLIEFLRARLDEDERTARAATQGAWKLWGMDVLASIDGTSDIDTAQPVASTQHEAGLRTFNADHIARWDPARVLSEVEAKRQVIEYAEATEDVGLPSECWVLGRYMVRALAQPYADHPDFVPEWRLEPAQA